MKKIFIIFVLGLFSCETQLDTKPADFLTPTFYFNSEADLNTALAGVYDLLGSAALYAGSDNLASSFDIADEWYYKSRETTGRPDFYVYSSADSYPNNLWRALYTGVERANLLLANIDKPEMDEKKRAIIRGEVTFLRAYYYFVLVQNFGAVPLRDKPTASVTDVNYSRTPASEVYDFVIKQMEMSEPLVNPISVFTHSGRITQSVVQGILARVCLYKAGFPNNDVAKYADALKWAKKVIDSGLHDLNPDYSQVFINMIQNKYDTKESIWEVEFYTTGATDAYGESGNIGVNNGVSQSVLESGFSPGLYGIHQFFYNKFEANDLRRDWEIAPYSYLNGAAPTKVYWTDQQIYNRQPGKYRREYETLVGKVKNQSGTNFPLLRYSDVLLMAAEAENELNGPTNAVGFVNQVRRRAYGNGRIIKSVVLTKPGTGYTSVPTVAITGGGGANTAGIEPAAINAAVSPDGQVSSLAMKFYGTFYASAPTVTITGGGGSGAAATVVLSSPADADLLPVQSGSKENLRRSIQDERSRELAFEALRRLDLVRWGLLIPVMRSVADYATLTAPSNIEYAGNAGKWVTEKNYYVPIPLRELTLNRLLVQTAGW